MAGSTRRCITTRSSTITTGVLSSAIHRCSSGGAFGENISTTGLGEADLCWATCCAVAAMLLQVAQTRQPCWKLNDRFGVQDMSLRVRRSGLCGWYYSARARRAAGRPALLLEQRAYPRWPLTRVMDVLYRRPLERADLLELAELPLVPNWRTLVERRLQNNAVEDWSKRLDGTANPEQPAG